MVAPFPPSPSVGDQITGPYGEVYEWDGVKWSLVPGGGSGGGASVEIGDTPPASPSAGNLWWDTVSAQLFIWDSTQWVVVTNQPPSADGGPVMGITDGSEAGPGEVGEYLSTALPLLVSLPSSTLTVITQLDLTPGDWDVMGSCGIGVSPAFGINYAQTDLYQTDSTVPNNNLRQIRSNAVINLISTNVFLTFQGMAAGRLNVTVPTTVFLCASASFIGTGTVGNVNNIFLSARRIR